MKTKIFSLLLALIASVGTLWASDTEVNGIWYDFDSNTEEASVTYRGSEYNSYSNEYSGAVTIPPSVTYNNITYKVTSIGDHAFSECTGLTSITIPNSVTSIGSSAFWFCTGLTSITIPNSVTSIGSSAFWFCTGLTSITIPNSVTSIGEYAFQYCIGLTSVTFPNSVTSIGRQAFEYCLGLTSVTISNGVTSIGYAAFQYCTGLTSIVVNSGNTKYDSRNNCNAIIEKATNTLIAGCKNTVIPNSVTRIGNRAFSGCTGLTSITIPNSVTSIEYSAFSGCTGLTSITIPNSVTSIEYSAFFGCTSLTSIVVNSGNTKYDSRNNCNAIIETSTNTLIAGCKNTVIPNSVTSIGFAAFGGCTGLTSVTIPNSVTSIGGSAFFGCTGLTSVTIPNSVTSIGNGAFYEVANIIYDGSATGLPWGARSVNGFVDGYLVYSDARKTNLLACFSSVAGEITIPNSVTSIGWAAFRGCTGLTSVTIPNSVTSIGHSAFLGCTGLTSVTCYRITPPYLDGYDVFIDISSDCILYVLESSLAAYESWKPYFLQILPISATGEDNVPNDVTVTPSENTVNITWPQTADAATYELVIKDKNGNVICTLVFNANGQLTQIAFAAPSRINAPAQAQAAGFAFTVTGLESGTAYDLTLTAKNGSGATLNSRTVSFSTQGPTALEDIADDAASASGTQKVMIDGQIYILRDGKVYNAVGAEVK